MFYKKVVFKYFVKLIGKKLLVFLFLQACNVIKKETPSQVLNLAKFLKTFFLLEYLRWLLLPNLKPLDLLRQLCKWISKLVTVYFISTFLVLVGIFMFIFGEHKLSFYISIALWLRRHVVLACPLILIQHLVTLWVWSPHPKSPQPAKFGTHRPCESEDTTFFICHVRGRCVTWLCTWGSLILSHHLAKFGVHRPCESGDITFFICHVTAILKCHMTWWVGSPHPKPPPC